MQDSYSKLINKLNQIIKEDVFKKKSFRINYKIYR